MSLPLHIRVSGITTPSGANVLHYGAGPRYSSLEGRSLFWIDNTTTFHWVWSYDSVWMFEGVSSSLTELPTVWTAVGGEGVPLLTAVTTISISTPAELQALNTGTTTKSCSYIQENDIDLNVSPYNAGFGFTPIGTSAARFTGAYNGNHFEIQNLFINRGSTSGIGLFGYTSSTCVLKNIKMRSCTLTGSNSVGALVGETSGGYFANCSSTGAVSGAGWNIGGLMGKLSSGVVEKSWSSAAATCTGAARTNLGGLMGSLEGWNGQTRCADCYALGRVTGAATTDNVGGFAGSISSVPKISRCYALGLATGRAYVGQFSGNEASGPPTMTACYWISDNAESTSRHGARLSTAQAKDKLNYPGWNFKTPWDINPAVNSGYPILNPRVPQSATCSLYQSVYRKR